MIDALAVLAAGWGVMMAIAPLLQIRRIVERRSSADVSLSYLGVLIVGFVLWFVYGFSIDNPTILIPNAVALVVGIATVVVALRFRERPDAPG